MATVTVFGLQTERGEERGKERGIGDEREEEEGKKKPSKSLFLSPLVTVTSVSLLLTGGRVMQPMAEIDQYMLNNWRVPLTREQMYSGHIYLGAANNFRHPIRIYQLIACHA